MSSTDPSRISNLTDEDDAQSSSLASRPPLGWNSWNCYGMFIQESELLQIAEVMSAKLKDHGWQYVVMDAGWFNSEPKAGIQEHAAHLQLDRHGRLLPCPVRFPSSVGENGLRHVTARIHELGLRFGVHLMRGIPRAAVERDLPIAGTSVRASQIAKLDRVCRWNPEMFGVDMSRAGGQAYYDSVAQLLADWGVDFVKADDMAAPYYADEVEGLSRALRKTGRPIVLSLSPGGDSDRGTHEHARQHAHMRRISGDLRDTWQPEREGFTGLRQQFDHAAAWQGRAAPGHWADLDMLPLGRLSLRGEGGVPRSSRLAEHELICMLTLWSVFQSPLMLGGDPVSLTSRELELLTNRQMLRINQHGSGAREVLRDGQLRVWQSQLSDGSSAVAIFNLGDEEPIQISVAQLALELDPALHVHDVWSQRALGALQRLPELFLPPHAAKLLLCGHSP